MMTDLGQPKKGHFIASGAPEILFSRGMGKCVEIIELGIGHKGTPFGIALQFVLCIESLFNTLNSHQKYVVSIKFLCLIQISIHLNLEIGLAVAVSRTAC